LVKLGQVASAIGWTIFGISMEEVDCVLGSVFFVESMTADEEEYDKAKGCQAD
jgi:hypothetical protein